MRMRVMYLADLDPTETSADQEAQAGDLEAANAKWPRRKVAISVARSESLLMQPIKFVSGTDDTVRQREESVLAADIAQLASSKASLQAQLAEKRATETRLQQNIAARMKLIALAKERMEMREETEARGAGSRALVIEAMQQYEMQMMADVADRGQLLETNSALQSMERKIEETVTPVYR